MPKARREDVFIPEADTSGRLTKQPPSCDPAPDKRVAKGAKLLPLSFESPWEYYDKKFGVRFWCLFEVIASKTAPAEMCMLHKATCDTTDKPSQILQRMCHPNIVKNLTLFFHDTGYFLVSEFMPTSLVHLCRAPVYPSEPQLSSMLHQVGQSH